MAGISSYLPVTNLKKLSFSDQFLSSTKKKVVSRFGLGVMLSFIVLSVLLCNISYKGPFLNPVFNGFSSFRSNSSDNSSIFSWPFSGGIVSLSNDTSILKKLDHPVTVNEALEANVAEKNNKNSDSVNLDGENLNKVFEDSHMVNGTDKFKDEGLYVGEASFGVKTDERNGTISVGAIVENKNVTVIGKVTGGYGSEDYAAKSVEDGVGKKGDVEDSGFLGMMDLNAKKSLYDCDIFNGRWVRDDTKPYYPASSCPFIDRDFDCHLNGRLDSEYVKWRWQPYECDIPRLNTTDFLERLRGKKLVFVGDSLNRNMWESLVCVLRHGVKDQKRVYEISGRHEFKKKGFYAFLFEDYNCTVDFVGSPFLVKESSFNGKNGSFETLRLDLMDQTTSMYHDADVIIFNTGHWWTHEKTSRGEDYYQEGNYVHPRLKVLEAYKRALATWARWVDTNIDQSRTQVIYRGYSVTHFRGGPWNSGGQCNKETEPIFNETYLAKYPSKMKILEYVLKEMKTPVTYLNISRLTDYRKDGHPSIYRPDYQAAQQEVHAQDCSHWCLPGVPDTWNHLLYVTLLKGLWKD